MSKQMVLLNDIKSFIIGGRVVKMDANIRQFYEFKNCFVVRLDERNISEPLLKPLKAFSYLDGNFKLNWEFPYNDIVGIIPIIPELKKEVDFITPDHYKKYIERFKGKELLEVYAGDFRYVLDANTGEVYDKIESRY